MTDPLLFCQYLRTVVLLRNDRDGNFAPAPAPEAFVNWLERYDAWFKQIVIDGARLPYLYSRSVSLMAVSLADDAPYVTSIAAAARRSGFGVLLQVALHEALAHGDTLESLCRGGGISTLFLDGRQLGRIEDKTSVAELALKMKAHGAAIIMFGSFADWRATGLLSHSEMNAGTFSFIPAPGGARNVTAPLADNPPDNDASPPMMLADPCSNRSQITITADGFIYPCQGGVGMDALCLGNIADDVATLHRKVELTSLIQRGPDAPPRPAGEPDWGFPPSCAAHRHQLIHQAV